MSDFRNRTGRNWVAIRCTSAMVIVAVCSTGIARAATKDDREQAADLLFSNREPIPELSIQIAQPDFNILRESRNSRWETSRPEVPATVREGTNHYVRVAVHLKGARGSFRSVDDKPALTLHFNEVVKGQRFHGLEKISLNNSVQDPTFMSEYLGRRLFTRAGIPVPRVTHAIVKLNGRHLGLYVLAEGWNQQFLRRHFTDTSGNFYEPPFRADLPERFDVKSGAAPNEHRALDALTTAIQERDDARRWTALNKTLDVERFITGMTLEVLLNHWDGYSRAQNNYRVFHDSAADRIVFFPHGMDQLFALRRADTDSALAPSMRGRVSVAVMTTREGRERYFERMGWVLTNVYQVDQITREIRTMSARLRPVLAGDSDSEALESFDSNVSRLLDRVAERSNVVSAQWKAATTPAVFTGTKPLPLRDWNHSGRMGGPAFARRFGTRYLQINSDGPAAGGSWRSTVLLNPGRYRFEGLARVEDVSQQDMAAAFREISLRSSVGDRVQRDSGTDRDGVQLGHEFVLTSRQYVDLICESNVPSGRTVFEPESLTLTRTDNGRP